MFFLGTDPSSPLYAPNNLCKQCAHHLQQVFADVDEKTPCVFVLSRGADPVALLMKFAASLGMENNVDVVSLGKGQGPRAEEVIKVKKPILTALLRGHCMQSQARSF